MSGFSKKFLVVVLLLLTAVPASFFIQPQTAEAQLADIAESAIVGGLSGLAGCAAQRYGAQVLDFIQSQLESIAGGILGGIADAFGIGDLFGGGGGGALGGIVGGLGGDTVPVTIADVTDEELMRAETAQAAAANQLSFKECFLDPILWSIVEALIESLTESMVTWANTGFEGAPTFVTDFNGFLNTVADRAMGHFIEGSPEHPSPISFMCEPFQLDLRLNLIIEYYKPQSERMGCTLTDVVNNVEDFFDRGIFADGGWQAWFDVHLKPHNNPQGAYLKAVQELNHTIGSRQNEERTILDMGDGFFSQRDENGNVVTPGKVIQSSLQRALDAPTDRLVVADEIDELVSVLFEAFITKVLHGAGGLLGFNFAPPGETAFAEEIRQANRLSVQVQKDRLARSLEQMLASEQQRGRTEFTQRIQETLDAVQSISTDDSSASAKLREQEIALFQLQQDIAAANRAAGGTGQQPGGGGTPQVPGVPSTPSLPGSPGGGGTPQVPGVPQVPSLPGGGQPLEGAPTSINVPIPGATPDPLDGGTTGGGGTGSVPGGGAQLPSGLPQGAPPFDFFE